MDLYVVRHGQVPSNVEKTVSGCSDEQLTPKGIEQAIEVKNKLQNINFDIVYCSPVVRAKQTAEIVVPKNEIILDSRLAERDPGAMLGKSRIGLNKDNWYSFDIDRTPEGVETLASGLKRVKNFLNEVRSKNENKTVLVVTHNFISNCIWILENNIQDKELISNFLHKNDEVKFYKQA